MQIELKESGGIANVNRRLLLEDGRVSVMDRGRRQQWEIDDSVRHEVGELVAQLIQREPPRRRYGNKGGMISDPTRIRLRIELAPGKTREVEVRSDPNDPPPEAIRRLIETLDGLFRG